MPGRTGGMMPAVQLGVLRRAGLPRSPAGGGFPLACGSPLKEWVREGPHDAGRLVQGAGDGEERTPCFRPVAGVPQLVVGDVELAGQDETASLGLRYEETQSNSYEGERDTRRQLSQLPPASMSPSARLPDPGSAGTSINPPDTSGRFAESTNHRRLLPG